jgi:hypothetical protein
MSVMDVEAFPGFEAGFEAGEDARPAQAACRILRSRIGRSMSRPSPLGLTARTTVLSLNVGATWRVISISRASTKIAAYSQIPG